MASKSTRQKLRESARQRWFKGSTQRDLRALLRRQLKELRLKVRQAFKAERTAVVRVKHHCRESRKRARQRVKELRVQVLTELANQSQAIRQASRDACRTRLEQLRQQRNKRTQKLALEAERKRQRLRETKLKKESDGARKRAQREHAKARRQESDQEVENNLSRELVPAWNSVKNSIRATPRRTRTEVFLEWAEENPGEVVFLQSEAASRDFASQLKRQNELDRALKKALKGKGKIRPSVLAELGINPADLLDAGLNPALAEDVREYLASLAEQASLAEAPF
jgi:hypothetical protein